MSISSFITSVCVQTAVYWEPTGNDGYGGYTMSTKEIAVRWDDKLQTVIGKNGKEVTSSAEIMTPETDINAQGYLWLGSLSALTAAQIADPRKVQNAHQIQTVAKSPLFKKTDQFVITIYL